MAVPDADAVYTDVWQTMAPGDEDQQAQRLAEFRGFRIDRGLPRRCPRAIAMHCAPMRRGGEIEESVAYSGRSVILRQEHNRLFVNLAILTRMAEKVA